MADKKKNGFFAGFKDKLKATGNKLNEKQEAYYIKHDPIYSESIHLPVEADASRPRVLKRSGIDLWFAIIVIALVLFGTVMTYSASSVYAEQKYGDSMHFLKNQIIYLLVSLAVVVPFVIFARPWVWRMGAVAFYAVTVVLLLLVLALGTVRGGAQRWIFIGPISIQPSELGKTAVVLMLSLVLSKYDGKLQRTQRFGGKLRYGILLPGILLAVICGLVALEKHLSGTIIIGLVGLTVMFIGGSDKKLMGAIIAFGMAAVGFILLVSDYARKRVNTWIHIDEVDPLGEAWQTLQGMYAIGSGGFFGLGLGNSRQKFGYVSQPQNDFIFTIICEELGFIGAFAVIFLFGALVWRGYRIAAKAPDKFSSLVVYGLTTKVGIQALLNMAVVTNLIPNTGVSLPFFSSGGTALIVQLFEMAIILSISRFSYTEG